MNIQGIIATIKAMIPKAMQTAQSIVAAAKAVYAKAASYKVPHVIVLAACAWLAIKFGPALLELAAHILKILRLFI